MAPREIARFRVVRVRNRARRARSDLLAVEEPMEIRVRNRPVAVTMRTPGDDFALAAGFLYTEGVVSGLADIDVISYCPDERLNIVDVRTRRAASLERLRRNTYAASSCGICGKASLELVRSRVEPVAARWRVPAPILYGMPDALLASQPVFSKTGGLHGAALFDRQGRLQMLKEDVGRHNAVDKVVGTALIQERLPLDGSILLVSGRESFEIVQKAATARIPVVCGISAPSSLAVDLARELRMTLVGMLRSRRMNVYSGAWRIQ
jgi:FdhD protein